MEDNPANVEVVSRFLRSRPGSRMLAAGSGRAGLDLAAQLRPDVILLDLHLPDMRGGAVMDELRARPDTADIAVAVLSADASPGMTHAALAAGAAIYLTKPLDLTELGEFLDSFGQTGDPMP